VTTGVEEVVAEVAPDDEAARSGGDFCGGDGSVGRRGRTVAAPIAASGESGEWTTGWLLTAGLPPSALAL
jgi:hypothetical protein